MNRNIITTISIFAIAIVVVLAGFFLLGFKKSPINLWALGSLLFSFTASLLSTVAFVVPKKNSDSMLFTAGFCRVIWIYEVAVIASVLISGLFAERLGIFALIQIVINAAFLVLAIVFITASKNVKDGDARDLEKLKSGEFDKPKRGGF